jgi:hypothetical protein
MWTAPLASKLFSKRHRFITKGEKSHESLRELVSKPSAERGTVPTTALRRGALLRGLRKIGTVPDGFETSSSHKVDGLNE